MAVGSSGGRCGVPGRLIQPPKHDVRIGSQGLPTIPGKKELPISFFEEHRMEQKFAEAYREYQQRVPPPPAPATVEKTHAARSAERTPLPYEMRSLGYPGST